jgi:hypothetical protein
MTRSEFMKWVEQWRAAHALECRVGSPDFGEEQTLEDWIGSLKAFATLQEMAESLHARRALGGGR